jgi:hypothetical protein
VALFFEEVCAMEDEPSLAHTFDMVREYVQRVYLNNLAPRDLYLDPNASVRFIVDDLDHVPNAYAGIARDGAYTVTFTGGLVAGLVSRAHQVAVKSQLIFPGVDRSDEQLVGRCHVWLAFIWVDFIFHHELAHIHRRHVDLVAGRPSWNEFNVRETAGRSELSPYVRQRLEAQADRYAAVHLLGQYGRHASSVSTSIYGQRSEKRFLRDYLFAVFYLFQYLEELEPKRAPEEASHPSPFVRANVFWYYWKLYYPQWPHLPPLTADELKAIVYTCFFGFYGTEYGYTMGEILRRMETVGEFMQTVRQVLIDLGLNPE